LLNATINLIGRWDMLAKYNNLPLNKLIIFMVTSHVIVTSLK
jgi:hypothetical protein